MKVSMLIGVASLFLWAFVAFGLQWGTGWAHVPLAIGVVMIARGIVLGTNGEDKTPA